MAHQQDYLTMLLRNLSADIPNSIETADIAQIKKLNKKKAICDLQPIGMIDGKKQAIIHNAKFLTYPIVYKMTKKDKFSYINENKTNETSLDYDIIKKDKTLMKPLIDYKNDDEVVFIVLKHDHSAYKPKKGEFNIDTDRVHDIDFAFVLGKCADTNDFYKKEGEE